MIGISLHSRRRRHTSTPSKSGSTRSTIAASGRSNGRHVEGLLPGVRREGLEPGVAQDDPQRAQDLCLVVHDEDSRATDRTAPFAGIAGLTRPSPLGAARSGARRRSSSPGREGSPRRSFLRSPRRNPLAIASPRPEPFHPFPLPGRLYRTARRSAPARARDPRSLIDDPHDNVSPGSARQNRHRPAIRVAPGVLQQVRESLL